MSDEESTTATLSSKEDQSEAELSEIEDNESQIIPANMETASGSQDDTSAMVQEHRIHSTGEEGDRLEPETNVESHVKDLSCNVYQESSGTEYEVVETHVKDVSCNADKERSGTDYEKDVNDKGVSGISEEREILETQIDEDDCDIGTHVIGSSVSSMADKESSGTEYEDEDVNSEGVAGISEEREGLETRIDEDDCDVRTHVKDGSVSCKADKESSGTEEEKEEEDDVGRMRREEGGETEGTGEGRGKEDSRGKGDGRGGEEDEESNSTDSDIIEEKTETQECSDSEKNDERREQDNEVEASQTDKINRNEAMDCRESGAEIDEHGDVSSSQQRLQTPEEEEGCRIEQVFSLKDVAANGGLLEQGSDITPSETNVPDIPSHELDSEVPTSEEEGLLPTLSTPINDPPTNELFSHPASDNDVPLESGIDLLEKFVAEDTTFTLRWENTTDVDYIMPPSVLFDESTEEESEQEMFDVQNAITAVEGCLEDSPATNASQPATTDSSTTAKRPKKGKGRAALFDESTEEENDKEMLDVQSQITAVEGCLEDSPATNASQPATKDISTTIKRPKKGKGRATGGRFGCPKSKKKQTFMREFERCRKSGTVPRETLQVRIEDTLTGRHLTLCKKSCPYTHHPLTLALGLTWHKRGTPHQSALRISSLTLLKSAMESGWDKDSNVPDSCPALRLPLIHLAFIFGRLDALKAFLEMGLNPCVTFEATNESAIHSVDKMIYKALCCQSNKEKVAKFKECLEVLTAAEPRVLLVADKTNKNTTLHTVATRMKDLCNQAKTLCDKIKKSKSLNHLKDISSEEIKDAIKETCAPLLEERDLQEQMFRILVNRFHELGHHLQLGDESQELSKGEVVNVLNSENYHKETVLGILEEEERKRNDIRVLCGEKRKKSKGKATSWTPEGINPGSSAKAAEKRITRRSASREGSEEGEAAKTKPSTRKKAAKAEDVITPTSDEKKLVIDESTEAEDVITPASDERKLVIDESTEANDNITPASDEIKLVIDESAAELNKNQDKNKHEVKTCVAAAAEEVPTSTPTPTPMPTVIKPEDDEERPDHTPLCPSSCRAKHHPYTIMAARARTRADILKALEDAPPLDKEAAETLCEDPIGQYRFPLIHLVCIFANEELLKYLLDEVKCSPLIYCSETGTTPLSLLIVKMDMKTTIPKMFDDFRGIFTLLIENDFRVLFTRDRDSKKTVFHVALERLTNATRYKSRSMYVGVLSFLLKSLNDLNKRDLVTFKGVAGIFHTPDANDVTLLTFFNENMSEKKLPVEIVRCLSLFKPISEMKGLMVNLPEHVQSSNDQLASSSSDNKAAKEIAKDSSNLQKIIDAPSKRTTRSSSTSLASVPSETGLHASVTSKEKASLSTTPVQSSTETVTRSRSASVIEKADRQSSGSKRKRGRPSGNVIEKLKAKVTRRKSTRKVTEPEAEEEPEPVAELPLEPESAPEPEVAPPTPGPEAEPVDPDLATILNESSDDDREADDPSYSPCMDAPTHVHAKRRGRKKVPRKSTADVAAASSEGKRKADEVDDPPTDPPTAKRVKEERVDELPELPPQLITSSKHTPLCREDCTSVHHPVLLGLCATTTYKLYGFPSVMDKRVFQFLEFLENIGWNPTDVVPDDNEHLRYPLVFLAAMLGRWRALLHLTHKDYNPAVYCSVAKMSILHVILRYLYDGSDDFGKSTVQKVDTFKTIVELIGAVAPLREIAKKTDALGDTAFHAALRYRRAYSGKKFEFHSDVLRELGRAVLNDCTKDSALHEIPLILSMKNSDGKTCARMLKSPERERILEILGLESWNEVRERYLAAQAGEVAYGEPTVMQNPPSLPKKNTARKSANPKKQVTLDEFLPLPPPKIKTEPESPTSRETEPAIYPEPEEEDAPDGHDVPDVQPDIPKADDTQQTPDTSLSPPATSDVSSSVPQPPEVEHDPSKVASPPTIWQPQLDAETEQESHLLKIPLTTPSRASPNPISNAFQASRNPLGNAFQASRNPLGNAFQPSRVPLSNAFQPSRDPLGIAFQAPRLQGGRAAMFPNPFRMHQTATIGRQVPVPIGRFRLPFHPGFVPTPIPPTCVPGYHGYPTPVHHMVAARGSVSAPMFNALQSNPPRTVPTPLIVGAADSYPPRKSATRTSPIVLNSPDTPGTPDLTDSRDRATDGRDRATDNMDRATDSRDREATSSTQSPSSSGQTTLDAPGLAEAPQVSGSAAVGASSTASSEEGEEERVSSMVDISSLNLNQMSSPTRKKILAVLREEAWNNLRIVKTKAKEVVVNIEEEQRTYADLCGRLKILQAEISKREENIKRLGEEKRCLEDDKIKLKDRLATLDAARKSS